MEKNPEKLKAYLEVHIEEKHIILVGLCKMINEEFGGASFSFNYETGLIKDVRSDAKFGYADKIKMGLSTDTEYHTKWQQKKQKVDNFLRRMGKNRSILFATR